MKPRLSTILILLLMSQTSLADFNDGVVAFMSGDHEKALSVFVPLAETTDHAYAQYFVGRMYAAGQGVDKNSQAAAKWYRKASELGVADAQFRLGDLYQNGDGVPRDMESAYGWYRVAAHLGNPKAIAAVERSAGLLSPAEFQEAEILSSELIEKYGTTPKTTARTQ
jgi:TPR repeat protein